MPTTDMNTSMNLLEVPIDDKDHKRVTKTLQQYLGDPITRFLDTDSALPTQIDI